MDAPVVVHHLDPEHADDTREMSEIAELVNRVFTQEDRGLWRPGHTRTDVDQVAAMVRAGELVTAQLGGTLVGVIRVQQIEDRTAYSSMLVTHPDYRGRGLARLLREYVFDHLRRLGVTTLRIDNIAPRDVARQATDFMTDWNERAGYAVVGRVPFEEVHPELVPMLLVPCDFILYEKEL